MERAESQLLESIAHELPDSNADADAAGGESPAHEQQHKRANGVAPAAAAFGSSGVAAVGGGGGALSEAALLALNSALVFNVLSDQPTTLAARVRHAAPGDESECARFVADMERYRERVTAELVDGERLKFVAELMALQGMCMCYYSTYSYCTGFRDFECTRSTVHIENLRAFRFINHFGLLKILEY